MRQDEPDPGPPTGRTGSAPTAYDGRRAAGVAVVGVTVLVTLLVTWAASIGPSDVLRGGGLADFDATSTPSATTSSPTASGPSGDQAPPPEPAELPLVLKIVMAALLTLFVTAVVGLLALGLRYLWHRRIHLRRRSRPEHVDFGLVEAADSENVLAAAMAADASGQLAVLGEGTPRNGIVACWARFEQQAAVAGVRPEAWETSSEFALRILEMVRADTSAVASLAELFREARYSEHEVTEQQRARAVDLLGQIHASLGPRRLAHGRVRSQ